MAATSRQIQSRLGAALANRLLLDNPACILDGSPLRPMFGSPAIPGRQRIVELAPGPVRSPSILDGVKTP
jgi:hypothetical protein